MKCHKCCYEWQARIEKPKSCPRCKRRFDYQSVKPKFEMFTTGNSVLMLKQEVLE